MFVLVQSYIAWNELCALRNFCDRNVETRELFRVCAQKSRELTIEQKPWTYVIVFRAVEHYVTSDGEDVDYRCDPNDT